MIDTVKAIPVNSIPESMRGELRFEQLISLGKIRELSGEDLQSMSYEQKLIYRQSFVDGGPYDLNTENRALAGIKDGRLYLIGGGNIAQVALPQKSGETGHGGSGRSEDFRFSVGETLEINKAISLGHTNEKEKRPLQAEDGIVYTVQKRVEAGGYGYADIANIGNEADIAGTIWVLRALAERLEKSEKQTENGNAAFVKGLWHKIQDKAYYDVLVKVLPYFEKVLQDSGKEDLRHDHPRTGSSYGSVKREIAYIEKELERIPEDAKNFDGIGIDLLQKLTEIRNELNVELQEIRKQRKNEQEAAAWHKDMQKRAPYQTFSGVAFIPKPVEAPQEVKVEPTMEEILDAFFEEEQKRIQEKTIAAAAEQSKPGPTITEILDDLFDEMTKKPNTGLDHSSMMKIDPYYQPGKDEREPMG